MKKTIFITGSTDGIGQLAAKKFINDDHKVIVHGRSQKKLDALIAEIKTTKPNAEVEGIIADLSQCEAINKIPELISQKTSSLDVLINNAGVFQSANRTNSYGLDLRFMVNYFAVVELSNALIPLLKESDQARVINLSSAAQESVNLDALSGHKEISNQSAYAQSKLALTMWSFQWAKQFDNWSVIPVNPGSLLNTKMVQEAYGRFWSSADKGANILYELALDEKYKNINGQYFDNDLGDPKGQFGQAHPDAYDQSKIESLLLKTTEILNQLNTQN